MVFRGFRKGKYFVKHENTCSFCILALESKIKDKGIHKKITVIGGKLMIDEILYKLSRNK